MYCPVFLSPFLYGGRCDIAPTLRQVLSTCNRPPSSLYSKPRMDAQPGAGIIRRIFAQPTDLTTTNSAASTVSKPRGFPFRVGAFSASFIESSMDGSVYEEWLSEMAGVDPRHIKDITEGLVCHLLILHRNVR